MFRLLRFRIVEEGAFGVLLDAFGEFVCFTLERTYDNLEVKILPGVYDCQATRFHRGGYDTFEVMVSGHSRILFHRGNVETDSDGCILTGAALGVLNGARAVLKSRAGFANFVRVTAGVKGFKLSVEKA